MNNDSTPDQMPIPAHARQVLGEALGEIIDRLGTENLTPAQLRDALLDAVEGYRTQMLVGGADVEGGDDGAPEIVDVATPLTRLAAAALVADAAEVLTHHYAAQARAAGYTWTDLANAARLKGSQNAHWRWEKNPKDWAGFIGGVQEREGLPVEAVGLLPAVSRPSSPRAEGWLTAAQLGREIGKDARTVQSMAKRGEIEALERRGPTGRNLSLYRMPGGSAG